MQRNHRKAYTALKKLGVPVFTNDDHEAMGIFGISAEESNSSEWVNYFNSPKDWVFGVHPDVDRILFDHELFAEWQNPGFLNVYNA